MNKPPKEIDGARVIEWAWSGDKPFSVVHYETGEIAAEIFGIAICRYDDSDKVYRISCNANWDSEQDSDYLSVKEAKENLPVQYRNIETNWQIYE